VRGLHEVVAIRAVDSLLVMKRKGRPHLRAPQEGIHHMPGSHQLLMLRRLLKPAVVSREMMMVLGMSNATCIF
jgi:ribosomal protein S4E